MNTFSISTAGKQTELVANIYHNFREKEKSSCIRVIGPLQGHLWDTIKIQNSSGPLLTFPELVVLVDFVFPWGIEYPVVFLPQGLFTLWCLQMA